MIFANYPYYRDVYGGSLDKKQLADAGYDYTAVQKRVGELKK